MEVYVNESLKPVGIALGAKAPNTSTTFVEIQSHQSTTTRHRRSDTKT